MKPTLLTLLLGTLIATSASAGPGIIAQWTGDVFIEDTGLGYVSHIAQPEVWGADPTVTVSKFTMHGSISRGSVFMSYAGWGTAPSTDNYVGFTVTPKAGATLNLTSLDFDFVVFQNRNVTAWNWGYRIDEGTGYGPWTYASPITGASSQRWDFPSAITTSGTVEFGWFSTTTTPTTRSGPGLVTLRGTAGDTSPDPNLQGTIGNYTRASTYIVNIQEGSSITYNWDTGTLFACGDEGNEIIEFDKKGRDLSQMAMVQLNFSGSGRKGDPEALSYTGMDGLNNPTFMIGAERENVAIQLKYYRNGNDTPPWIRTTPTVSFGLSNGNSGLEGVCFDNSDGTLWGIREIASKAIFHVTNVGTPEQTITPIDMNDINWRLGITAISDIYVMSNSAAFAGSDHLLILAREQRKIVEITKTGKVVTTLDYAHLNRGTTEGITMDDDGVLYLLSEGSSFGESGSSLHVFTHPKNPVLGSSAGRQVLQGTTGDDEISGNPAADSLIGRTGADTFIFKSLRDGVDTINDFTPGEDILDFTEVLAAVGYIGLSYNYLPLTDGTVRVMDSPSGAVVQVKSGTTYRSLALLPGLTAAQVNVADNFRFRTSKLN